MSVKRGNSARRRKLKRLYGTLARLVDIQPGDTLILETDRLLPRQTVDFIRGELKKQAPQVDSVVLCGGLRLAGVIRSDVRVEVKRGYSSMAECEIPNL